MEGMRRDCQEKRVSYMIRLMARKDEVGGEIAMQRTLSLFSGWERAS